MNEIKLNDEPLFLAAVLCLFYPIGIIFLLRSKITKRLKWFLGVVGLLIFASLLSLSFIRKEPHVDPSNFELTATRTELSIGQSGGLILSNGEQYYADYDLTLSNDVLKLNGNAYTASKPGTCTITATFANETRQIDILVNNEERSDSTVLITLSGERYHLPTARHAGKNAIEVTEEDAIRSGKSPCKNCYK